MFVHGCIFFIVSCFFPLGIVHFAGCVCVYMCVHGCICVCMSVYVCICVYMCAYVYMGVYSLLCFVSFPLVLLILIFSFNVCTWAYMCVHGCISFRLSEISSALWLHPCRHIYTHIYTHVHTYTHKYTPQHGRGQEEKNKTKQGIMENTKMGKAKGKTIKHNKE